MKSVIGVLVAALVFMPANGEPPAASTGPASITLGPRHGHVAPSRQGFTHTGGGNILVAQPAPDTIVVTFSGAAMAGAHPLCDSFAGLQFDLVQAFELSSTNHAPVKLSIEARALGFLRSYRSGCCHKAFGSAETSAATATIASEHEEILSIAIEPHAVAGGEDLSVNDHEGPVEFTLPPGKYTLHQAFAISAAHVRSLLPCGHASAEFAPESALDPLWI